MKNLFECKDEKITEKAFSQSLIISVVSILLCLVALCSMSYAWFNGGVASDSNSIKAGFFDLTVSVAKSGEGDVSASEIKVTENEETDVWSCKLAEEGTYTVTLTMVDGATVKGFCYVKIGAGEEQPTDTIMDTNSFTFTIETTNPDTIVEFRPCWGVHSSPVIKNELST